MSIRRLFPANLVAVLLCTLLVVSALLAIERLQAQANASHDAELALVSLRLNLAQIQYVPWGASPSEGDDPAAVRSELIGAQQQIERTLDKLSRDDGLRERDEISQPFSRGTAALWQVFDAARKGDQAATAVPSSVAAHEIAKADDALQRAARRYHRDSLRASTQARLGSAAVILVLFAAFASFYWRAAAARSRAESLARENRRLAAASREEALTDALTGLRNRRALLRDLQATSLEATSTGAAKPPRLLLVLFDLNGFKQYNDTFGHPAGDALLARLGARLARAMDGIGTAYRMGGDEFCVLAPVPEPAREEAITRRAAAALAESGVGFRIGSSHGAAVIPTEASGPSEALALADQRMYAHKTAGRLPAGGSSAAR